jgi:FkbH-like protein
LDAAAVVVEWPDLDSRLGYRQTGGWGPAELENIVTTAGRAAERLVQSVQRIPNSLHIALSLPTLPLPPVFYTSIRQTSIGEMRLREAIVTAGRSLAALPNVAIVSSQLLGEESPFAHRYDLKSDLLSGLPYTIAHASALAKALTELIAPSEPRKALITDLDDTLWNGVLGDVGAETIAWDLASQSQIHALYQQLLRALADQGVLIAVASKNDPNVVDQAFARPDILLPRDKIFPMEAHWHAKSASVARILQTWNIGADSVVFVDDSPMELAEVGEAHPGIQCLQFPKGDYAAAAGFLRELRQMFARPRLSEEDVLRRESIRQSAELRQIAEGGESATDAFLAGMNARIIVDFERAVSDARVLELINKTNQFNLTTVRRDEAEVAKLVSSDAHRVYAAEVSDRFGNYGLVAVAVIDCGPDAWQIDTFLMSCRVLRRGVEGAILQCIADDAVAAGATTLRGEYRPTQKNGQVATFYPDHGFDTTGEGRFEAALPLALVADHVTIHRHA